MQLDKTLMKDYLRWKNIFVEDLKISNHVTLCSISIANFHIVTARTFTFSATWVHPNCDVSLIATCLQSTIVAMTWAIYKINFRADVVTTSFAIGTSFPLLCYFGVDQIIAFVTFFTLAFRVVHLLMFNCNTYYALID